MSEECASSNAENKHGISAGFIDLFIDTKDDSQITRRCWGFKTLLPVNTAWEEKLVNHYEFQDWTDPLFTSLANQMVVSATSQQQQLKKPGVPRQKTCKLVVPVGFFLSFSSFSFCKYNICVDYRKMLDLLMFCSSHGCCSMHPEWHLRFIR